MASRSQAKPEKARNSARQLEKANAELRLRNLLLEWQAEATTDGVLAIAENGKVMACNRKFAEVLRLGLDVLDELSGRAILKAASEKLIDPAAFVRREESRFRPDTEVFADELQLRDDRVLEQWSVPLTGLDGAYCGRMWFFRDVTEHRRSTQEIRRLNTAVLRSQEEERRRLALALHDSSGQVLAALALKIKAISDRECDAALVVELAAVERLVAGLAVELRRLSHDLRPVTLDRLGLVDALEELVETHSSKELAVEFELLAPAPRIETRIAEHLFRIAQAALANVAQHAKAKRARITLTGLSNAVRLAIEDDGAGFDLQSAGARVGIGLLGIRERATSLGGTLTIDSSPGRGSRIVVEVPLSPSGTP